MEYEPTKTLLDPTARYHQYSKDISLQGQTKKMDNYQYTNRGQIYIMLPTTNYLLPTTNPDLYTTSTTEFTTV